MMDKKFSQVTINLEQEDVKALTDLMRKDGFTYNMRSAFLRRLIRQEWQRRQKEAAGSNPTGKEMK
jgi:metal-responsive CopG/Arc/MetJ family transcriptional regulator